MNWLDILISLILSVFIFFGLRRGLVKELVSIVAINTGIIAGVMFYQPVGDLFIRHNFVKNKAIASVGGFIVVMFGIYIALKIIGWGLGKIIGTLHLNWIDRISGGIFGGVKGVIVTFLIISALSFFFPQEEPLFKNSILTPYIDRGFSVLEQTIPADFKEKLQVAKKLIQEKGINAAIKDAEKVKEILDVGKDQEKKSKK
jgi:membrane protein required for colicin V production